MKTKKLYKFLREGMKSEHGKTVWKLGEWKKEENISICNKGFHASDNPYQAFSYVQGEILAVVEARGKSVVEDDKSCWEEMRVVKAYKWEKKDSVAFSIFAAELIIKNYEKVYPNDTRPREAIEAAKKWLADPTKKNESAESAAWSAWSAARSAESAAESAAWSAARSAKSAAESAAWSAAWSAWSAARKEIFTKCAKWMLKRIETLEEVNPVEEK